MNNMNNHESLLHAPISEATLQVVEHALQTLSKHSLKDFLLPEGYLKSLRETSIEDLPTVVAPNISDRYCLRIVSGFNTDMFFWKMKNMVALFRLNLILIHHQICVLRVIKH